MRKEKARDFCIWFLKRNLVLIISLAILVGECLIVRAIAYHNAYKDAEAKYKAYYDEQIADYVSEWEKAHAETEDEILQAQIDADVYILERVGMGVLNTYDRAELEDAGTQMQTCINRVLSGGEFQRITSIAEAVAVPGAWTGFDMSAIPTEEVHELAVKLVTALHKKLPMPCSAKFLWTEWDYSENELVSRDKYMIDSSCHYWRYSAR